MFFCPSIISLASKNEDLNDVIPALAYTEYYTGIRKRTNCFVFYWVKGSLSTIHGHTLLIPLYPKHVQFDDVGGRCATENVQIEVQDCSEIMSVSS